MKQLWWKVTANFLAMLFVSTLASSTAFAYVFGAPPITEIAEDGQTQSRFSGYQLNQVYSYPIGYSSQPETHTGISLVKMHGDSTGGKSFMYRASSINQPADTTYGVPQTTGFDLGTGFGFNWNLLSDRRLGIFLNLQLDLKRTNWSDSSLNTTTQTEFFYGPEIGVLYRFFSNRFTITPFVQMNSVYNSGSDSYSLTSGNPQPNDKYSVNGPTTSFGVDIMYGKVSLTFMQTSGSLSGNFTSGSTSLNSPWSQKTTGSWLSLGYNY